MINQRTIEQVYERADIVDVVSDYVELRKAGVNYKGLCPFHQDHAPSLIVSPAKNICKCFACGKGGNPVSFVMAMEGCSYPEAVERLARKYNIEVRREGDGETLEQERQRRKRESAMVIYEAVTEFYRQRLLDDDPKAKAALCYVRSRWDCRERDGKADDWDRDYATMARVGYAPDRWTALVDFARQKGYDLKLMEEVGLVRTSSRGTLIDTFRDRVMIPVTDRFGRVIAFTARTMQEDADTAKYVNNKDSFVFHKGRNLFGLDIARKKAVQERKMYLVEGAPDCMKLQGVGVENTVAALGTAWTEDHFALLKAVFRGTDATVCLVPDNDRPGVEAVKRNGRMAMRQGFRVTVTQLPEAEDGRKVDADSYVNRASDLGNLKEDDFVTWYAAKTITHQENTTELTAKIKDITELLVLVDDEMTAANLVDELGERYGTKQQWRNAMKLARKAEERRKAEALSKRGDIDLLKQYGFYEENNCCYSNENKQWSNFIMRPLFHIKDPYNSKRIYKLVNRDKEEALVEMKEAEMYSLNNFRERVGSMGNFRWKAGQGELNTFGDYLYDNTETAVEIKQLGWNQAGFFVWGNGIVTGGKFLDVDEYGICRVDRYDVDGKPTRTDNYYLPAMSRIYADQRAMYKFERQFIHDQNHSSVTLPRYCEMMAGVFGDNAKVGVMFLLATLFRDIVVSYTKNFPILNLFGPKGSGKSELGHTLMSFFIKSNTPVNIQNATIAALADAIAQCANALVHIDEYKNSIDPVKVEFLKGLYDGAGRSRMNMDLDKKREITSVDSAVVLSGQEMPTVDIALFSRTIYLTFQSTVHTPAEKQRFNELAAIRKMGVSHLTNEILSHRQEFEANFYQQYNFVTEDLAQGIQNNEVEDRIWRDWSVLLASYRCLLGTSLSLPWTYEDVRAITLEGIKRQNQECAASNELGAFWDMFENLVQMGFIFEEADYKLKYMDGINTNICENRLFDRQRRVLMLRPKKIIYQYKKAAKMSDEKVMSERSIRFYLTTSPGYLGRKKGSERFDVIINGQRQYASKLEGGTNPPKLQQYDNPLCFDYEVLSGKFELNLETSADCGEDPREGDGKPKVGELEF